MLYRSLELEKDQKSYKVYNDGRTFRSIARVRRLGRIARSGVRDFGKEDSDVAVQRLSNLLGRYILTLFDYRNAVAYRPFRNTRSISDWRTRVPISNRYEVESFRCNDKIGAWLLFPSSVAVECP
jgi:hypothetical protein